MKLHLPIILRKAVLTCLFAAVCGTMCTGNMAIASPLELDDKATVIIDYSQSDAIIDLEKSTLQLMGNTELVLSNCNEGDGKYYTLFTGVSSLLDKNGNELILGESNDAVSLYFNDAMPGSGFWANGTLILSAAGELQLVLHNHDVAEIAPITATQNGACEFLYNKKVEFKDIKSSSNTGAIYLDNPGSIHSTGTIILSYNGTVIFDGRGNSSYADNGGAIYGSSIRYSRTITLDNNGSVSFIGNAAGSKGGAIYGVSSSSDCSITLNNNGSVSFVDNKAGYATVGDGGAIFSATIDGTCSLALNNNGSVSFIGNAAGSNGGAITHSGTVTLNNNGSVSFIDNAAGSKGGAISHSGTLTLNNNGSVSFIGNAAGSDGGAIYYSGDDFSLRNNKIVLFEKNYTISSEGTITYNSLYLLGCASAHISAPKDGWIEFRDSIYVSMDNQSDFHLNDIYIDENNQKKAQTGDIIFTAAHTSAEEMQASLLQQGIEKTITDAEIIASKTTTITRPTKLHDGRLIIRDGAIWESNEITVLKSASGESTPTIWLDRGELRHRTGRGTVSIAKDSALRLSQHNILHNYSLSFASGSTFIIDVDASHSSEAALSFTKDFNFYTLSLNLGGSLTLQLNAAEGLNFDKRYILLKGIEQPTYWDRVTVTGGVWSTEDLRWEGDTLYLNYPTLTEAIWNNYSGDRKWNVNSSINWEQHDINWGYQNGISVVFNDEGSGNVILEDILTPSSVLINSSYAYNFEGAGSLSGNMSLTKKGNGILTINNNNSYTGGTIISGGTLVAGTATALGTGNVTLNGGTLEIAASGITNTITNNGTSSLVTASGITHQLNNSISNTGVLTLSGSFDASSLSNNLTGVDVRINDLGVEGGNSGFLRTGDFTVLVANGTVNSSDATVLYGSQTLQMNGGIGSGVGTVDYTEYLLTGSDTASVSKINAAAGSKLQKIDMQGGTLNVDESTDKLVATNGHINLSAGELGGSISGDSTTVAVTGIASISGNNSYAGGTTLNNGKLTITHANALGTGDITATGDSSLIIGSGITYNLTDVIDNNGTLIIGGNFDASALAKSDSADVYVDVLGNETADGSGFTRSGDFTVLVANGTVDSTAASVIYKGTALEMNGGIGSAKGGVLYGEYRILSGHEVSSSAIHGYHADSANATVIMSGGTLNANDDVLLTATGGQINLSNGTISGTLANVNMSAEGGTIDATFDGNSVLIGTEFNLGSSALANNGNLKLSGNFDASALAKSDSADVYVDVLGNETADGSGFTRSGDFTVLVANGTVDSTAATVIYKGTELKMNGGIGSAKGGMLYGEYRILDGHEVSSSSIHGYHADSANATVIISGGTLNADDDVLVTATGGNIMLSHGTISGTLANVNMSAVGGTISATFGGNSILSGTDYYLGSSALANNGNLKLSGTFDASGLSKNLTGVDVRINDLGVEGGNSGFLRTGDFTVLVANGTVNSSDATVLYGSQTLQMNGGIGSGEGTVDYSEYLLTGTDIASVSKINAAAGSQLQKIDMQGGTLNVDESTDKLIATNGHINLNAGELGGSISGDTTTVEVTGIASISGNNSYVGGTTLNNGKLTITHANALGTGDISATGESSLLIGSGVTYNLTDVIDNNGTLIIGGNFDASALAKSDSADVYVDVLGNETADGSGFTRSGDFTVLVANGTVDSTAASVIYKGTALEMNGGIGSAEGGMLYGEYRILDGHEVSSSAIHGYHADSANATVIISGGTLNADDDVLVTATGGNIMLSHGTISGTLANVNMSAVGGTISATFGGNSILSGTDYYLGSSALANNGNLKLSGTFDASGLSKELTGIDVRINDLGVEGGNSGFLRTGDFTILVANGTVNSSDATVLYGSQTLQMNGGIGSGVGTVDYSEYLLTGTDIASVSKINAAAGSKLQKIDMQGGTLNVDESTDKLVATNGHINLSAGELGGSISGDTTTVEVTGIAIISGNNSYVGGTTLNNGKLTITHANALGTGDITATGENSLIIGSGVTYNLTDVIDNNGTLIIGGNFDASALAKSDSADVYVDVLGNETADGSGFTRSGDFTVLVANGTVDSSAATVIYKGTALEMNGGIGSAKGGMLYGEYRILDGHEVSSSAIHGYHADSANATVIISGGTLNADDDVLVTATGGNIMLSHGTISGTLANVNMSAVGGTISATFGGNSILSGTDYYLGSSALANNGNLKLSGTFDASGLSKNLTGVDVRINDLGVEGGNSGFLRTGDFTVLVANGTVNSSDATVLYGSQTLQMNGGIGSGEGTVDYSEYLLTGTDIASVSKINAAAGSQLQKIDMQGGTLNVDESTDKLIATNGHINLNAGELGGSISGDTTTVEVTGIASISGNNSYVGGTTLNNGKLTITHANALGTGDISATGESSLIIGSGVTYNLTDVIDNNGTLIIGGNFDASALAKSDSADVYVDVLGNETADGSGFTRSGDFTVLVANGTVDSSAATVIYKGTALEMNGGIGSAKGGMLYGEYRILDGHEVSSSAIHGYHADSANATVIISGGTLNADDDVLVTATGGNIMLSHGTISGTLANVNMSAVGGTISATFGGNSILCGTDYYLGSSALANNGNLKLSGSFDASGLSKNLTGVDVRINDLGVEGGNSGFLRTGDFTVLVANGTVNSSDSTVLYGSQTLQMNGGIGSGEGTVDYSEYLLTGTDIASVSKINAAAGSQLHKIDMQGATLYVDESTDKLIATNGHIYLNAGELGGSISGDTTTVEVTGIASISGNNSYVGGTTLNNGKLTITHANALGTGDISATGESSLIIGSGVTYNLTDVIDNNGTLIIGGNFDASALAKSDSADVYVDVLGNETADGSGFIRSGDFTVLVANGTVDSTAATVIYKGTELKMNGGIGSAKGGMLYGEYRILDGHEVSSSAIHGYHADSANATVIISGGTLNANDDVQVTATGGQINLSNGTISGSIIDTDVQSTADSTHGIIDATMAGNTSLVVGGGKITVSGANSYIGGTKVNAGVLVAGSDTAFGSGDIVVHDGGSLDLAAYSTDNKVMMRGNSTFLHANGASHIILDAGANTQFETGFTLTADKNLTVNEGGATYTGSLTLDGGTLCLGGMLTVDGEVDFLDGSQTPLDLSLWSGAGDGTVLADFGVNHNGYTEESLTLKGIAGEWLLDFNTTTGRLTLVAYQEPDFTPDLTQNQKNAYDTIKDIMDDTEPDGELGLLGDQINTSRDEEELRALLDEIGGTEYATLMSSQIDGNLGHLRRLRERMGSGYMVVGSSNLRASAGAFSEHSNVDGDSNGYGYNRSECGVAMTLEYVAHDNLTLGVGIEQGSADLSADKGLQHKEDSTRADVYMVYNYGAFSSKTSIGVSFHNHDLQRNLRGREVTASADGTAINFMQEVAWNIVSTENDNLQLFASIESSLNKIGAFSESDTGTASLHVDEQDAWATDITAGARYTTRFAMIDYAPKATFSVDLGVVASIGDTQEDIQLQFAGAKGYQYIQSAAERERWGFTVGAGLNIPMDENVSLFISGNAILRGDSNELNANLGVQCTF